MIGVIGLDHHRAPMAVRERLAFTGEALREAVLALGDADMLSEVVILSTCNRTEVYAAGASWTDVAQVVETFLTRHYLAGGSALPALSAPTAALPASGALSRYLSVREGLDAARHLFNVVAGLRS